MIPGPALVALTVPLALLGVAVGAGWLASTGWWIGLALIVAIASVDWIRARRLTPPTVERNCPLSLSLGRWCKVQLQISSAVAGQASVFDGVPQSLEFVDLPQTLQLREGQCSVATYRLRPTSRGEHHFSSLTLRLNSPWRLWQRNIRLDIGGKVAVFPDFSRFNKELIVGLDRELKLEGIRLSRRRGEGSDFHQLREYREGDSLRSIDWKATARGGHLVSKEYREERNQTVLLVVDGGRRMLAQEDDLSHFDHVLNAALMLGYVALKYGDSVGAYFLGRDNRWVPPRRGASAIDKLLEGMFDWAPQPVAIDFAQAATDILCRYRKRALIVLLTNARDEDTEDLVAAINLLARRNLVFVASLRETVLDDMAGQEITGLDSAIEVCAAERYLAERRRAHLALKGARAMVVDTTTDQLATVITNRYIDIKRAGAL